jgi:hypothetical protein
VADFGISILLSAPTYTLTQIQLAQVYVDTQGRLGPQDVGERDSQGGYGLRQSKKVDCAIASIARG